MEYNTYMITNVPRFFDPRFDNIDFNVMSYKVCGIQKNYSAFEHPDGM